MMREPYGLTSTYRRPFICYKHVNTRVTATGTLLRLTFEQKRYNVRTLKQGDKMLHPRTFVLRSLALLALILSVSCRHPAPENNITDATPPEGSLQLLFPYGSEKEKWITEVTDAFNRSRRQTKGGKTIFVTAKPMGSGESIDEVLGDRIKAHVLSPASAAFIKLGNAKSRTQTGKDLVASTQNLVLSPVVVAMWKPMAEALGWPAKSVGWAEIIALARNPKAGPPTSTRSGAALSSATPIPNTPTAA